MTGSLSALICAICLTGALSGDRVGSHDPPDEGREALIPRIKASAIIDGLLEEAPWSRATVLHGFYQFAPSDDRSADDSTQVLVWYSADGIYFGIRAYEAHGEVHGTQAERDRISTEDYILLLLDTFDDRRQAFVIGVNPFGIQADGIIRDKDRRTGSIARADETLPYEIDDNPDFVYHSAGRLTPQGYVVEVYVPFKSLRYQSADTQQWGFNIIRRVQHSGFTNSWTRVLQNNASFLSQSGRLVGLTEITRRLVLDVTPELASTMTGSPGLDGWSYESPGVELGGSLRWGLTNNLALTATVNPDFSQIEADVQRVSFDPRQAVFFPEKRSFFLEGIELFNTPFPLIHTRQLSNPIGAVKLTGKASGTNIGVLSGIDRRSTSLSGMDFRYFNAIRLTRDVAEQSTIGVAYADRMEGERANHVVSADGRFVLAREYSLSFQGAGSFTNDGTGRVVAPLWWAGAEKSGRRFGLGANLYGIHGDFRAESGAISRVDIAVASIQPRWTLFGPSGSTLETFTTSANLTWKWKYDDFVDARGALDRQVFLNTRFGLAGGWLLGTSVLFEHFGYPKELYEDYFVARSDPSGATVDTVAFVGTPAFDDISFGLSVITPRFRRFSADIYLYYGRNVSFFEWADAYLFNTRWAVNWNPTDRLRIGVHYRHIQYIRPGKRTIVQLRRIPRLKIEYQLGRALFVRLVGQYDSNVYDAFRDYGRTGDPILIRGSDGILTQSEKIRTNTIRIDWLISYRPTPGTVFFLGYGSSMGETSSFRLSDPERISDGFFLKLSYLFRR